MRRLAIHWWLRLAGAGIVLAVGTLGVRTTHAAIGHSSRTIIMEGQSMYPTLRNRERLRVDSEAYRHGAPARGDIVVFHAVPAGQPDKLFIKRVLGLPGETIAIHNAAVYINNHRLRERYVAPGRQAFYTFGPATIPRNEYFVLGDNRNNSDDSHLWRWLPRADIVGRVVG